MKSLLIVALGGAVGSVARFKLSGWILHHTIGWRFPAGTFAVKSADVLSRRTRRTGD
jgi:fluoride exporter